MGLRKNVQTNLDLLWDTITDFGSQISSLQKHGVKFENDVLGAMNKHASQIYDLQTWWNNRSEHLVHLDQEWNKNIIKTNELKTQITKLKQDVCGLKTKHEFEYTGDLAFNHMFVCKLCGYLVLKTDNELTPVERKSLQTLGILQNEPAKKRSDQ
jgi:hypothetical protein